MGTQARAAQMSTHHALDHRGSRLKLRIAPVVSRMTDAAHAISETTIETSPTLRYLSAPARALSWPAGSQANTGTKAKTDPRPDQQGAAYGLGFHMASLPG